MWPFLGPLVVDANDPNTAYQSAPFTNPAPWRTHVPTSVLNTLVSAGFDHIRLPVAPGPWLDAVRDGDESRLTYLFGLITQAIGDCLAAGLHIIIDMHDAYYVRNMPPELLAGGTSSAIWLRRIEVTRRFAQMIAAYPSSSVALELFNEPLAASDISGNWKDYQASLYAVARPAAPNHTLCLTAENYSGVDQLVAFDPSPYDSNTMWVIHPYIPAIFAIQGYPQGSYNKYVYGLGFPPDPTKKAAAISAMTTNVNADASLTAPQKTAAIAQQTTALGYYFDIPQNGHWINQQFDTVVAWCKAKGISPSRIWAGEYGVTRDNGGFSGTALADRVAFSQAIGPMLAGRGFRRSVFALDALDYGVTDGSDSTIGTLISGLIA